MTEQLHTLLPIIKLPDIIKGQINYFIRTSIYLLPFILGMYGYRYYVTLKKYFANPYIFASSVFLLLSTGILIASDSYYSVFIESFASFIIVVGCNETRVADVLSFKPFVWLGKISYSVYLYHTLACYFYTTTIFKFLGLKYPLSNIGLNLFLSSVFTVLLSILFGCLSYRYIEKLLLAK